MKKRRKQTAIKSSEAISPWYLSLLIILCLVSYANSLTGSFVWDDQFQVVRNETIRSFVNLPHAFSSSLWAFMYSEGGSAQAVFNRYYRPLQTVLYMAAYAVGGLSPFPFHVINLLLHLAATVLIYALCLQVGLRPLAAFVAATLFALHPVHTEAVSWIAGVGDLVCGVFYFAALWALARHLHSRTAAYVWVSAVCFLLALLSKEVAITFPISAAFLCLMIKPDLRTNPRSAGRIMTPYMIVLGFYAVLRVYAIGVRLPPAITAKATILDWLSLGVWAVGQYMRYGILPYPLSAQHAVPLHFANRIMSTIVLGGVILAMICCLWIFRRRMPNGFLWLGIFVSTLLPVLYFQGSGIFFAERYLYIPSLAIVVLAAIAFENVPTKFGIPLFSIVAVLFFTLTISRNRDWLNEETLYRRTLQSEPASVKFWNNLAFLYLDRSDNQQARECLNQALQHSDDGRFIQDPYEKYRVNLGLGIIAGREGRLAEAKVLLNKALEFEPQGDGAYATLAGIFLNDRDYAKAGDLLQKAIQINPKSELNWDYMGVNLVNQGQYDQAINCFREALRLNPNYEPARQHLDFALQNQKR